MSGDKTHVEHLELCLRTVEDELAFALSLMRAIKFNRDPDVEHHRDVVLARMREVRAFAMNWAIAADAKLKADA